MKKIAFIIVRYGENINGGAEVHCQMLAERLLPYYEVEVLTTTIRAFNHPDQDYTEGVSSWNGVTIRRFKPQPIDQEQFRPFRKKYKTARRIRQYLKKLNLLRAASFLRPEWKSGNFSYHFLDPDQLAFLRIDSDPCPGPAALYRKPQG